MNSLFVIHAKKLLDTWVFDDAQRELIEEPFVLGTSEAIDFVLDGDADECKITHAKDPFPGYTHVITRGEEEYNGYWYDLFDKEDEWCQLDNFWLCPATKAFYGKHPEFIYVKIDRVF